MSKWTWETPDPSRSGVAGDLAKLFRNEPVKNPGILAASPPSDRAVFLAREVIQNAWDAALELRSGIGRPQHPPPAFEIGFTYRSDSEDRKRLLVRELGLDELAEQLRGVDRKQAGLGEGSLCLDELTEDNAALTSLLIEERGTTGMYGPWESDRSKLWMGMVSVGYTRKSAGSGGSFGYGKAGMIRSTATRTVVAYTCFKERAEDRGVTRRLLGMTYWGQHKQNDQSYTGFAWFGKEATPGKVEPFENEEADRIAESLGIGTRSPTGWAKGGTGTTFLLIQPTVEHSDLVQAIERYWWPALTDYALGFSATVRTREGKLIHPRPRKDEILRTFIDAYEIATGGVSPSQWNRKHVLRRGKAQQSGLLGLVSDPEGWSFPGGGATPDLEHRSLVALMRRTRMVVEYLRIRTGAPYVRGAFVASDEVDDLLRSTEPRAHDAWKTTPEDQLSSPEAFDLAKSIKTGIRNHVRKLRKTIKPPEPPPEQIELPFFDRIMRRLMSGRGSGDPLPSADTRPVTIELERDLLEDGNNRLRLKGLMKVALSEHHRGPEATLRVAVRYKLIEDDIARASLPVEVDPPPDFREDPDRPGAYVGVLAKDRQAEFGFITAPYRSDWSGRLYAEADIVESAPN